jgi:hypothetical protein
MFRKLNRKTWILWILLPLVLINGCNDRVAQIAREAADRQAQQNTEMARLNKEVASGSHQLVEADAITRKEIVGVHRDLQAEQTRLDTSRSELESERRQIAGQRRTESMLVVVSELLLPILVLGFCWYTLVAVQRGDDTDAKLNELLIREILPDETPLLSSNQKAPSLLGHSGRDSKPVE